MTQIDKRSEILCTITIYLLTQFLDALLSGMGPIAAEIGLMGLLWDRSQVSNSCSAITFFFKNVSFPSLRRGVVTLVNVCL